MPFKYNPFSSKLDEVDSGGSSLPTAPEVPGGQLISGFDGVVQWYNPRTHMVVYDEFMAGGEDSWLDWDKAGSGQTWRVNGIDSGHPGVMYVNLDATSEWAELRLAPFDGYGGYFVGGGRTYLHWISKISALSDATNDFTVRLGIQSKESTTWQNGFWFEYNHASNSGNWQVVCDNGGSQTVGNSTVTADTDFHTFGIEINADGTSIKFTIDGTEVTGSPITTNIYTDKIAPSILMVYNASDGTNRSLYWDQFYMYQELTIAR